MPSLVSIRARRHQRSVAWDRQTTLAKLRCSWIVRVPPPSSHALHSNVSNWIASDSSECSASAPTFSNATSLNITASCHYLFKTRRTKYQINNGEIYRESSIFITFFMFLCHLIYFLLMGRVVDVSPAPLPSPERLIITKSPSFVFVFD